MFVGIEVERHGQNGPKTIAMGNTLDEAVDATIRHVLLYNSYAAPDAKRLHEDLMEHRRGLVPHDEVFYMIVALSSVD